MLPYLCLPIPKRPRQANVARTTRKLYTMQLNNVPLYLDLTPDESSCGPFFSKRFSDSIHHPQGWLLSVSKKKKVDCSRSPVASFSAGPWVMGRGASLDVVTIAPTRSSIRRTRDSVCSLRTPTAISRERTIIHASRPCFPIQWSEVMLLTSLNALDLQLRGYVSFEWGQN